VSPLPKNLRIVEPEEMAVAKQQHGKHIAMATVTHDSRISVEHSGFCAVQLVSNTEYVVKGH
jgi:hypothetical protein